MTDKSLNWASQAAAAFAAAERIAGIPRTSLSAIGRCAVALLILLLLALPLDAATASNAAAPFFRHRESTLGYHGPSDDLTNLTEIRLGWFGPTNLDDPLTGDIWWAANFAIREANAQADLMKNSDARGAGSPPNASRTSDFGFSSDFGFRISDFHRLPFRLIPRWAVDPWGTGVSQLTRMVYDEQPLALLGSVDSASTHLAEQVVAKAQLPLVSPITTDKSVTLAGVSWIFSCAPSDAAIARVLVDDILATLEDSAPSSTGSSRREEAPTNMSGIGHPASREDQSLPASVATSRNASLALLAGTDHESRMTTREVVKEFSRRGRAPDYRFDVPPGSTDINRQMQALVESRTRAVAIVAGPADAARLVRAVRERLGGVPIFGSHAMGRSRFRELAGPAAEGVRFPLLFVPDSTDTNAVRFSKRFQSERQRPPDYTAALGYDATRLLLEAIRRAGPNRARVRESLTQLSPWPGITGLIAFDGTGQNTRTNICLGTIRNGAVISLPKTHTSSPTTIHSPKP